MAFCVKITGFVAGGSFFLCWPIASRYPKYRYLVSPFKWVLWDIPTDGKPAIKSLGLVTDQSVRSGMVFPVFAKASTDEP